MDTVHEFFNSKVNFGQTVTCVLGKKGDLLSRTGMHIKVSALNSPETRSQPVCSKKNCLCTCSKCLLGSAETSQTVYGWANAIGHVLLEYIEVYIGGQLLDRQYGEWLEIWTELTQTAEKRLGYYEMVGKKDPLSYNVDSFTGEMELYVPFNFWFCRNIGQALPVLCLVHHDVEIKVKIRDFDQCWVCNRPNALRPKAHIDASILADYVYLSSEERQKFYIESHTYLIDQVQLNDNNHVDSNGTLHIDLCFKHPVKELVWFLQRQDVTELSAGCWPSDCTYPKGNDHFNFSAQTVPRLNIQTETFQTAKLSLNGVDRTAEMPASYFRLWQNYFYHTRIPTANYIYSYGFALAPEDHQPSGSCNMGQTDNAVLSIKLPKTNSHHSVRAKVYAVNQQVLLISGGMAAILFH